MKFLKSSRARLFLFLALTLLLHACESAPEVKKVEVVASKTVAPEPETKALGQAEEEFGAEGTGRAGSKSYVVQLKEQDKRESVQVARESLFSLHFKEIALDAVINMLSDRGRNFRYVIHPDVGDKKVLGLVLENVTWRDALEIVTKLHSLVVTEEHGLIIINTEENMAKAQEIESKRLEGQEKMAKMERSRLSESTKSKQMVEGEKRTFQTFKLKYAEPNDVVAYLEKVFNGIDGAGGAVAGATDSASASKTDSKLSFSIFSKASIVTAYGTPSSLSDVEKRLVEIDVPQQQIFIEARIVEVFRNYSKSIGVEWGGGSGLATASGAATTMSGGANTGGSVTPPGVTLGNSNAGVSFPASDVTGGSAVAAAISLALPNATDTTRINMRLMALEVEGKSKTLSNPKITTINGVKARIESGREIPYQQSSGGTGATSVAFKNAVISLEVTPFVTPDSMINMRIQVTKDDADFSNLVQGTPSILKRSINTNVLIVDGGTAVLGGVFENSKVETERGVPWLSKIPIVGWFFKGNDKIDNEKELLIFITPRIVRGNFS